MTKKLNNAGSVSNSELQAVIKQLSKVMQAMNNRASSLKPRTYLKTEERAQARQQYVKQQSDMIIGEMMMSGLFGGMPGGEFLLNTDSWGDALMTAAEDIHESAAWQEMTAQEKAIIRMRQHMYKKELSERKRVEKEQSRIEKTVTALAMAVGALEKRMVRHEARQKKKDSMLAFVQNRHSMKNSKTCKYRTSLKQQKLMLLATNDSELEAA